MSNSTWLPFFEEMLKNICGNYDKFSLCSLCHDIFGKSGELVDEFADGQREASHCIRYLKVMEK